MSFTYHSNVCMFKGYGMYVGSNRGYGRSLYFGILHSANISRRHVLSKRRIPLTQPNSLQSLETFRSLLVMDNDFDVKIILGILSFENCFWCKAVTDVHLNIANSIEKRHY
jgi:hypothetical protein